MTKLEALNKLLYCVDGMCSDLRERNFGSAEEWVRHIDNAYSDYQDVEEGYTLSEKENLCHK